MYYRVRVRPLSATIRQRYQLYMYVYIYILCMCVNINLYVYEYYININVNKETLIRVAIITTSDLGPRGCTGLAWSALDFVHAVHGRLPQKKGKWSMACG